VSASNECRAGDKNEMQDQVSVLTRLDGASVLSALRDVCRDFGPRVWDTATEEQFPTAALDRLQRAGLLRAALPTEAGGLGWGTEASGAVPLSHALRLLGATNLSLGRVVEGHVNAIRLLHRCATPSMFARAAQDVRAGHLFGLWVTSFADPVLATAEAGDIRLRGVLDVCSGARIATRAVIMARDEAGSDNLVYVDATRSTSLPDRKPDMMGMRGTSTLAQRFDQTVPPDAVFGRPGDYMAEPDFSAGAWRTSAVTLGGLEALVAEATAQLAARDRHRDPHQQARIGDMLMARQTALLWLDAVARMAEADDPDPGETAAFANLARLAIERACLEVIPLVQRSLGLAGMRRGNPVERLIRDLSTYLRQPAGDEVLAVASAWFTEHGPHGGIAGR
jgi:alkylation response protein AidB-like acyl-CoA dehydrogenase